MQICSAFVLCGQMLARDQLTVYPGNAVVNMINEVFLMEHIQFVNDIIAEHHIVFVLCACA